MPECSDTGNFIRNLGVRYPCIRTVVESEPVLQRSVTAVGVGAAERKRRRDQSALCGALQKRDIAHIVEQGWMPGTVSEDQKLDCKFDIDQTATIVLEVKELRPIGVTRSHLMAHIQNCLR